MKKFSMTMCVLVVTSALTFSQPCNSNCDPSNENTFIGANAAALGTLSSPGIRNSFLGHLAGENVLGSRDNTIFGYAAGENMSGSYNAFYGSLSGRNNSGENNSAFGFQSGEFNGNFNATVGAFSGIGLGDRNACIGVMAGGLSPLGSDNVYLGYSAGYDVTGIDEEEPNGDKNTFVGAYAGFTSSGSNNVFIGNRAGYGVRGSNLLRINNELGTDPLIFGNFSDETLGVNGELFVRDKLDVGASAVVGGSVIASGNVEALGGRVKVGSSLILNARPFHVQVFSTLLPGDSFNDLGNNVLTEAWDDVVANEFISFSDKTLKQEVQKSPYGLESILKLKPILFKYTSDLPDQSLRLGFNAQEVLAVVPELVKTHNVEVDKNGASQLKKVEVMGMNYAKLTVVLVRALQEQAQKFEQELSEKDLDIQELEKRLLKLEKFVKNLSHKSQGTSQTDSDSRRISPSSGGLSFQGARLDQNTPNPSGDPIQIGYYLPKEVQGAQIQLTNMQGQVIKQVPLTQRGEGQVQISGQDLPQGTYLYSLLIEGQVAASKRLTIGN